MSSPRAATSVATSTRREPDLKSPSAWSRSRWSLSPCITTLLSTRMATSSHIRFVLTKITAWSSPASRKMPSSRSSLSRESAQRITRCSTSGFTRSSSASPALTSTGSRMNSIASRRTAAGQVAVNISVCRSCGSPRIIFRICGSKPMSNIRSASSSTRYWMPFTSTATLRPAAGSSRSFSRPGVATRTWGRCRSSASWGPLGAPP
mmetsp:Transcript_48107/g.150563  ORF Transcript_48107/g.150563 Transcript_48107/m.150563 type:complete len:206 (+) Transcript_48107:454-1071(+)